MTGAVMAEDAGLVGASVELVRDRSDCCGRVDGGRDAAAPES